MEKKAYSEGWRSRSRKRVNKSIEGDGVPTKKKVFKTFSKGENAEMRGKQEMWRGGKVRERTHSEGKREGRQ